VRATGLTYEVRLWTPVDAVGESVCGGDSGGGEGSEAGGE
jgi:hypothetical protein